MPELCGICDAPATAVRPYCDEHIKGHTVEWTDGLKVSRAMTIKGQMILLIDWQGKRNEVRLGKRVHEIRRIKS